MGQQFRLSSAGWWFWSEVDLANLSWVHSCICSQVVVKWTGLWMTDLSGVATYLGPLDTWSHPSSSRPALAFSEGGYRVSRAARKQTPKRKHFSSLCCVVFATVLLAKAKGVVKSRVIVGGGLPKLGSGRYEQIGTITATVHPSKGEP